MSLTPPSPEKDTPVTASANSKGSSKIDAAKVVTGKRTSSNRGVPWRDWLLRLGFLAILVALWHVLHFVMVTTTGAWPNALFPSPKAVGLWLYDGFALTYFTGGYEAPPGFEAPKTFGEALGQKPYVGAIMTSITRLIMGYGIALVVGVPAGLLVARFPIADKTLGWLTTSLQALPSICWIPLALLWFGRLSSTTPVLFVTATGAVFATTIAVADSIRNVPPLLSRAGRTLGAKNLRLYFEVLLPAALPGIVTGLKIGWSFAWRALMSAEIVITSSVDARGLGYVLQHDAEFDNPEGVLATIVVILLLGVGVQSLVFSPIEKALRRKWGLSANH